MSQLLITFFLSMQLNTEHFVYIVLLLCTVGYMHIIYSYLLKSREGRA